jgi:hypothetical protein
MFSAYCNAKTVTKNSIVEIKMISFLSFNIWPNPVAIRNITFFFILPNATYSHYVQHYYNAKSDMFRPH